MRDFPNVYRQYRRMHSHRYSLQTAWRIAVRGLPF